ncbi:sulfite exporter TauE/SafE family protein [Candidatus Binatus sp.]|uniref:sulfite exporter TauE/SafE family protein n=1 Tax=Candidatus Binatus sp. TaxID=2811406 RepID=UPI003BB02555
MVGAEGALLALFGVALFAATVNGALGYGFSSLTVPLALLFFPNRVLSPALVLVELAINSWLVVMNRQSLAAARGRAMPIIIGLIPGILIGSYLLTSANPGVLKFWTYVVLLPLILSQAAGYRRPIHSERAVGVPLGVGVGVLYSTTTISGPPLAMLFNNQGIEKNEFRAALGTVRIVETTVTAVVYCFLGLFTSRSIHLLMPIAPAVLLGLPLGTYVIRHLPSETFRRVCMSFDAWIVGFGLARAILDLRLLGSLGAYGIWGAVILFDLYLLYRYFLTGGVHARIESLSLLNAQTTSAKS